MTDRPALVVVGGGIAGLAAARTLARERSGRDRGVPVVLLEASSRLGGKIRTDEVTLEGIGTFSVEAGPDSFLTRKPEVLQLVDQLRLADALVPTQGTGGSFVHFRGRLRKLPEGLVLMVPSRLRGLLATDLLSPLGKARALMDLVIPPRREAGDESLASFVGRRLGREVLERIAEPLIAGIHGAEPETMSLKASFPRMLEMERMHGSLIRAALAGARRPPARPALGMRPLSYFMSFENGMETLPRAITQDLEGIEVVTGAPVRSVGRAVGGGFTVRWEGGEAWAEGVILTLDAAGAADILRGAFPAASREIASLRTAAAGTVSLAFDRKDVGVPLQGHGFVVPRSEGRPVMGVTYSSLKWPHRSPDPGVLLVRVFLGGTGGQAVLAEGERRVADAALSELRDLLGVAASVPPLLERTYVFPRGMPQYQIGHLERIERIEAALRTEGALFVAGSPYHGIGVPDAIGSGERAARRLLEDRAGRGAARSDGGMLK